MLKLTDIEFPIYPLRRYEKVLKGSKGALYILDRVGSYWVIDDTSIKGTFGVRRLALSVTLENAKLIKLYPLKKSLKTVESLLRFHRRNLSKTYIDSTGKIFKYTPTAYVKLTYHRIIKIQVFENNPYSILVLEGVGSKIKTLARVESEYTHAGILHTDVGMLFYGFSVGKAQDTVRKV